MKRFFIPICLVLVAFSSVVIAFAHPGGTDGNGGHYDRSTGEYHYHHGYPAHQHEDGECPYRLYENDTTTTTKSTEIPLYFGSTYIDKDNLEDVLSSEFGDEHSEEIRDVIVFDSDTELIEFYSAEYIEYESLWDTAMEQYGESITERIFSHPDLMTFSFEDILDRHNIEKVYEISNDDTTEYTEEDDYEEVEEKSFFGDVIDKEAGIIFCVLFCIYVLSCIVGYFSDKRKQKKRSRN